MKVISIVFQTSKLFMNVSELHIERFLNIFGNSSNSYSDNFKIIQKFLNLKNIVKNV